MRYHFIAIGGIGMSGLAKYLLEDGHEVSGSDIVESKYVDQLRSLGAKVYIGHKAENVPTDAIVIKSSAIREENPELIRAKELGLKIYHRSDLLEEIAKSAQDSGKCFIGFSGTHGKTTTSGLASFVLEKGGVKPSFVDGGIIPELNTNAQHKDGNYFIAELDESDGTITKYYTDILVINNLEEDHLDYYKNGTNYELSCANLSDQEQILELPMTYYRGYVAEDSQTGGDILISSGDNGRIRLTLAGNYTGTIQVKFKEPVAWRISEVISLFSVVGVACYFFRERRSNRRKCRRNEE